MKSLLVSLTFAALFIGGMILFNVKIPVKYTQIFADKKICLTDHITWGEKFLVLPKKKGFVSLED